PAIPASQRIRVRIICHKKERRPPLLTPLRGYFSTFASYPFPLENFFHCSGSFQSDWAVIAAGDGVAVATSSALATGADEASVVTPGVKTGATKASGVDSVALR